MKNFRISNAGFSLVELTIVIGIIGLVLGGIMGGRHLLRAQTFNKVLAEREEILSASRAFFDKFNAYPGDMPDATRFFGRDPNMDGDEAFCLGAFAVENRVDVGGTCNGDGDRYTGQGTGLPGNYLEIGNFAQHLALAGFISGTYLGYGGVIYGLNDAYIISRSTDTRWAVSFLNQTTRTAFFFDAQPHGNAITLSLIQGGPFPFTPEEAWIIDKKGDDGMPATGNIFMTNGVGSAPNCTATAAGATPTNSTHTTAVYNLKYTDRACYLVIPLGF